MSASHHIDHTKTCRTVIGQATRKRIKTVLTSIALAVIAVLGAVDIVRTAPLDAPVVQATFDVAPPSGASTPMQMKGDGRWEPDESAQGTPPDRIH